MTRTTLNEQRSESFDSPGNRTRITRVRNSRPRYKLIRYRKKQRVYAVKLFGPTPVTEFSALPQKVRKKSRVTGPRPLRYTRYARPGEKSRKKKISFFFTGNRVCGLPAPPDARPANSESSFSGDRLDYRVLYTYARGVVQIQEAVVFRCF